MGLLLKFILFAVVIIYLLRKVGGVLYRIMGGAPPQQYQQPRPKGDINVETPPKESKKKFGDDFKGGEYVDYEEIK